MDSSSTAHLIQKFLTDYEPARKDAAWRELSERFRSFWSTRVMSTDQSPISDAECDEVIRILDRNGKGNTKNSEAVAKAMVPQGAWRRMFNEFHLNRKLGSLVDRVMTENDPSKKAKLIDELYKVNEGQRNNLTGPSGNTLGSMLAAFDPFNNLSVISVKDRQTISEFFQIEMPFDWEQASVGARLAQSNPIILDAMRSRGLPPSARTISCFFYWPEVKALWKGEHTIRRADKPVNVAVPTAPEEHDHGNSDAEAVRESMQIQGLLAKIGTIMGFTIWLPKADRTRVLKVWKALPGELVDELPLGYDATTTKTIEQIDVLWLRKRSIVRAFEVEHTTSVYSGLLRMADLVALQPNINIRLHIVAPADRSEKVLQEIKRPVFSLLEGRALSEMCTYLSYDAIKALGELKHLVHLSDKVLDDYEEVAE